MVDKAKEDSVYTQLYFEMRRYRDYELTASSWWTAMLLAILSGLLWISYGSGSDDAKALLLEPWFDLVLTIIALIIGIGINHALHYTNIRYNTLRSFCDNNLEPEVTTDLRIAWQKYKGKWTPLYTIVCTIGALVAAILVILWNKTRYKFEEPIIGIILASIWVIAVLSYWFVFRRQYMPGFEPPPDQNLNE